MTVRNTEIEDVDSILALMSKVELPEEMFLKRDREYIKLAIPSSFVLLRDNKIEGICLITYKYYDTPNKVWVIDNIISNIKGGGRLLLASIYKRCYYASIHPLNTRSIRLFKSNDYIKVEGKFELGGYPRERYCSVSV